MAGIGQTLTREIYERLTHELNELKKQRAEVSEEIREAREQGDLRENFAYHDAKQRQGLLEARIGLLESRLEDATVLEAGASLEEVAIGTPVTVRRGNEERQRTYVIVTEDELDHVDNGATADSPIGSALIGKKVGDIVEVQGPAGPINFEILKIG
jgi:transcription elongation factor GreA